MYSFSSSLSCFGGLQVLSPSTFTSLVCRGTMIVFSFRKALIKSKKIVERMMQMKTFLLYIWQIPQWSMITSAFVIIYYFLKSKFSEFYLSLHITSFLGNLFLVIFNSSFEIFLHCCAIIIMNNLGSKNSYWIMCFVCLQAMSTKTSQWS